MAIEGSVITTGLSNGNATIQLPADNLTICAVQFYGCGAGFQINPGEFAYPPVNFGDTLNPQRAIIPVTLKMTSNQLIVDIYGSSGSGVLVVHYGAPIPGAHPMSDFKGVLEQVSFAASGSTTQTITVTMPKTSKKLTGYMAVQNLDSVQYEVSFQNGVGKSIYFYQTPGMLSDPSDISPLNVPDVSLTFPLTVAVSATTNASQINIFLYYS